MISAGDALEQFNGACGRGGSGGVFAQVKSAAAASGDLQTGVEFVALAVEYPAGGIVFQAQDVGGVVQPVLRGGNGLPRGQIRVVISSRGQRIGRYRRLSRSRFFQMVSVGPAWFIE